MTYICTVRKGIFSRVAAVIVLLTVLFTQVGVSLLHAHQGLPDQTVTLHSTPDPGATCQACALECVPCALFFGATELPSLLFEEPSFEEALLADILLPSSAAKVGRAPPVC